MDASTHNQTEASRTPYTLDVTAAPNPSAAVPSGSEPLLQLRALSNAGDPELQREFFKMFLTDDAAVQVQALLRLEEGDTGLDLFYPPRAPNWGLRIENTPDTGSRFTRLDVDSRLPTDDTLSISAEEAAALARRIDDARRERAKYSAQMREDGDEGGQGSRNDPTKPRG
ncbi:hypothetical protein [Deinococcus sp.]|uniref:hypothetical protein n=1 Tax=Deinococcus sp. TaxID=47478 RepID=UPI003C7DFEA8